jgi:AbrB family looped-hinge helix DNA binding protein
LTEYDDLVALQDEQPGGRIVGSFKVSARGQLSLPADVRRRWGIDGGGSVEIVDLGESLLLLPGGDGALWRLIRQVLPPEEYKRIVDEIGRDEPDLANE